MEGVGGKPAWVRSFFCNGKNVFRHPNHHLQAWIFILEGLVTVIAGALSFFIIQDFPETAKFLNETERAFVIKRLQDDDQFSAGGENLRWKYIRDSLLDWKTWIGSMFLRIRICFGIIIC